MNPNDLLQTIFHRMSSTYNFFGHQARIAQEQFSTTAADLLRRTDEDHDHRYRTAREHFQCDMNQLLIALPETSIIRESTERYLALLNENDTIWFTL